MAGRVDEPSLGMLIRSTVKNPREKVMAMDELSRGNDILPIPPNNVAFKLRARSGSLVNSTILSAGFRGVGSAHVLSHFFLSMGFTPERRILWEMAK